VDPTNPAENQIDAFILVAKCTPRASTLKSDLDHFRNLFGTIGFKSLIIVFIFQGANVPDDQKILNSFKAMPEVTNILKEGKEQEPTPDWYCTWDNITPLVNQKANLLTKIEKLEPYTHQKFLKAQEEMKKRIDKNVQEKVQQETKRLTKEFKNDQAKLQTELQKLNVALENERIQNQKALDQARKDQETLANQLKNGNSEQILQCFREMTQAQNTESQKLMEYFQTSGNSQNVTYQNLFKQVTEQQQLFQAHLVELMKKEPVVVEKIVPKIEYVEKIVEKIVPQIKYVEKNPPKKIHQKRNMCHRKMIVRVPCGRIKYSSNREGFVLA